MALRYDIVATVTAIVITFSSPLQAGNAGYPDDTPKTTAEASSVFSGLKKPEVSCDLKVKEKYRYYDVDGTDVIQLRKQMKQNGTKWNDGKVYAAVTSWDIRYSYDVSWEEGNCSVKSVRTDVEIVYQLPRRISLSPDPQLTALWDDYLVRLKEHEFGHKDLAVKTAGEINQILAALEGFSSRKELDREVDRRTEEKFRALKKQQVAYDDETHHGETQGAVLREQKGGVMLARTPGAVRTDTPDAAPVAAPAAVLATQPRKAVLAANAQDPAHSAEQPSLSAPLP
jgi:predicted secreted Zn-dependent protease